MSGRACKTWKPALLDAALGGPPVDGLERHLKDCAACADALRELHRRARRLDAGLAELRGRGEPSPEFRARVLAAAQSTPPERPARVALAGATLAVVAAAGLLGLWLAGGGDGPASEGIALADWRSPTAGLLSSPAEGLLSPGPVVGDLYFSLEDLASEPQRARPTNQGANDEV